MRAPAQLAARVRRPAARHRRDRRPADDDRHQGRGDSSPRRRRARATSSSAACSRPTSIPNADRLSVCVVDIGDDAPSQIVCGAPNVAAGQTVAVAKPGAVMPDGSKLGKAKLRGVESNGMILAEDEVAIGTEHAGIMVLEPDGLKPGHAAHAGPPDRHRRARARDHRRTVPTASASTASPARFTPRPERRWRRRPGARTRAPATVSRTGSRSRSRTTSCAHASPRACSRTSRSARARRG